MTRTVNFLEGGQDLGDKYVDVDDYFYVPQGYFVNDGIQKYFYDNLWAWGSNDYGQLGQSNIVHRSSPVQIGALGNWKTIGTGSNARAMAAIQTDGSLWMWGSNFRGQLGLGDITNRSSPTQVGALTNWKFAQSGGLFAYTTIAIKTDGTIWGWGENDNGQLGLGDIVHRSSPVQIGSLNNWKDIDANAEETVFAINTYGALWAWGHNSGGELGLGDRTKRSSPVQVGALTDWKKISSNSNTTAAIKTDGTLWTWGNNTGGVLGVATPTARSSPVQVGALTNWKNIIVSVKCFAIKTDGTLWGWGENGNGQLGLGDTTNRSSPTQVGTLTNWSQVALTTFSTAAIKKDGTLWTWGNPINGSLGNNASSGSTIISSPVQIGALTSWRKITGGSTAFWAIQ